MSYIFCEGFGSCYARYNRDSFNPYGRFYWPFCVYFHFRRSQISPTKSRNCGPLRSFHSDIHWGKLRTHCIRYCIFDVFVYTSESLQIACSTNYPVRFLSNLITFDMSFRWCFLNVNLVKISLRVLFGARDVPRQSKKFADVAKKIYDWRGKPRIAVRALITVSREVGLK